MLCAHYHWEFFSTVFYFLLVFKLNSWLALDLFVIQTFRIKVHKLNRLRIQTFFNGLHSGTFSHVSWASVELLQRETKSYIIFFCCPQLATEIELNLNNELYSPSYRTSKKSATMNGCRAWGSSVKKNLLSVSSRYKFMLALLNN